MGLGDYSEGGGGSGGGVRGLLLLGASSNGLIGGVVVCRFVDWLGITVSGMVALGGCGILE